jgi:hypothetical protein
MIDAGNSFVFATLLLRVLDSQQSWLLVCGCASIWYVLFLYPEPGAIQSPVLRLGGLGCQKLHQPACPIGMLDSATRLVSVNFATSKS